MAPFNQNDESQKRENLKSRQLLEAHVCRLQKSQRKGKPQRGLFLPKKGCIHPQLCPPGFASLCSTTPGRDQTEEHAAIHMQSEEVFVRGRMNVTANERNW